MHTRLLPKLLANQYLTYPLYPFSLLYGGVVRLWSFAYETGIKKSKILGIPVISVGNIVAGGTGKTSFVVYIVELLKKMGKRGCVLMRGYRSRLFGVVPPTIDSLDWGDEILLLRKKLPETPILTGKDRIKTGLLAIEKFHPDLLILDDGFQYLRLNRDLDILLIDPTDPFSGNKFPPCGLLREPTSSVSRADLIVLTRVDLVGSLSFLTAKLRRLNPEAKILMAVYKPLWLEHHATKERIKLETLKDRRTVVFSSIGNPGSFERGLEGLGAVIVRSFRFPDHHLYQKDELEYLLNHSCSYTLVATEKDSVKLPEDFPCLILKAEMVVVEGEELIRESIRSIFE